MTGTVCSHPRAEAESNRKLDPENKPPAHDYLQQIQKKMTKGSTGPSLANHVLLRLNKTHTNRHISKSCLIQKELFRKILGAPALYNKIQEKLN